MKVYVVILDERHIDTCVDVFSTKEAANAFAWELAYQFARDDDDIEAEGDQDLASLGWGPEGDCVWVVESEVDEQV